MGDKALFYTWFFGAAVLMLLSMVIDGRTPTVFNDLDRLRRCTDLNSEVVVQGTVRPDGKRWRWSAQVYVRARDHEGGRKRLDLPDTIGGLVRSQEDGWKHIRAATDQVRRYMAELNDVRSRTQTEEYPI